MRDPEKGLALGNERYGSRQNAAGCGQCGTMPAKRYMVDGETKLLCAECADKMGGTILDNSRNNVNEETVVCHMCGDRERRGLADLTSKGWLCESCQKKFVDELTKD